MFLLCVKIHLHENVDSYIDHSREVVEVIFIFIYFLIYFLSENFFSQKFSHTNIHRISETSTMKVLIIWLQEQLLVSDIHIYFLLQEYLNQGPGVTLFHPQIVHYMSLLIRTKFKVKFFDEKTVVLCLPSIASHQEKHNVLLFPYK